MSVPGHLFLAHFPVALIVTGAAADAIGAATAKQGLRRAAGALLVLGAATSMLTFLTGGAALQAIYPRVSPGDPRIEVHAQWGGAGVWALAAAGALRGLWRDRLRGPHRWILLAAAIASAVLVIAIAFSGAALSHG
ncbi:MAG TPA: DUF2231 domain-containing protein [Longimicrobium sp.]